MSIPPVSLAQLRRFPKMTHWFAPNLLARMLLQVVVSETFGQFADRRLIVAALDTVDDAQFCARARQFLPSPEQDANEQAAGWKFTPDEEGAVWIDYVADLGDGFDSTYAIASLLAQEALDVDALRLKRGQMLIMGGDEVYPNASLENYRLKLRAPYDWAFPDPDPKNPMGPPVFAVPGNHDWYDGLAQFLGVFARREPLRLGGWRARQYRSYFAVQVTESWWVWGMDAQLDDAVDQPQKDYFTAIAKAMAPGARIILCAPEPGWLSTRVRGNTSLDVINSIGRIALDHCPGAQIPLTLSGDTHHYSRYQGDDGFSQFVTAGGGGAFLHATHQLKDAIDLNRPEDDIVWLDGRVRGLSLGRKGGTAQESPNHENAAPACYPSREESRAMLKGVLAFPLANAGFGALCGIVYWLFGLLAHIAWPDAAFYAALCFVAIFYAYARHSQGSGVKIFAISAYGGLVHAACAIGLALGFDALNAHFLALAHWRLSFALFALEMIFFGGGLAAALFGLHLYISSRFLDMNHNDAFTAMRRNDYRNFLRIRICGDEAKVFSIGLTKIPRRRDWRLNAENFGAPAPIYRPTIPLKPHLIEQPFYARPSGAPKPAGDFSA